MAASDDPVLKAACFQSSNTANAVQALLAAGASASGCLELGNDLLRCIPRKPVLRILADSLAERAQQGSLALQSWRQASTAAVLAAAGDALPSFRFFCERLRTFRDADGDQTPHPQPEQPPVEWFVAMRRAANAAAWMGSMRVLGHLLQLAAAAGGSGEGSSGQDAAEGSADPLPALLRDHMGSMLAAAAENDQAEAVKLLLEAGQPVTWQAVGMAAKESALAALRVLLSAGLPAGSPPPIQASRQPLVLAHLDLTCPIHRALSWQRADRRERDPMDRRALATVEALLDAGYRPQVYRNVRVRSTGGGKPKVQLLEEFDPLVHDPGFRVEGRNRFLWLAISRPEWSPQQHRRFPPSFQQAVQALLLAAHRTRGSSGAAADAEGNSAPVHPGSASGQPLQLGCLPQHLLLEVARTAAYPLSSWAAADPAQDGLPTESTRCFCCADVSYPAFEGPLPEGVDMHHLHI